MGHHWRHVAVQLGALALLLALPAQAAAQGALEQEVSFAWPTSSLWAEPPQDSGTRVRFEALGTETPTELRVTIETLDERRPDGGTYEWNRGTYHYSWIDRGVLFLALPEEADFDYSGVRIEAFDKAQGRWVALEQPTLEDRDLGVLPDLLVTILDESADTAFGPLVTVSQAMIEVAALADELEGRIDVREVAPPSTGAFVDPNAYDTLAVRLHEPFIAEEYPTTRAGVAEWVSRTDFFDLREDPTVQLRFRIPVSGLDRDALARTEAWVAFVEHYAYWRPNSTSGTLVKSQPHTLRLAGADVVGANEAAPEEEAAASPPPLPPEPITNAPPIPVVGIRNYIQHPSGQLVVGGPYETTAEWDSVTFSPERRHYDFAWWMSRNRHRRYVHEVSAANLAERSDNYDEVTTTPPLADLTGHFWYTDTTNDSDVGTWRYRNVTYVEPENEELLYLRIWKCIEAASPEEDECSGRRGAELFLSPSMDLQVAGELFDALGLLEDVHGLRLLERFANLD